jgi:hypothetical protein
MVKPSKGLDITNPLSSACGQEVFPFVPSFGIDEALASVSGGVSHLRVADP